MNNLVQFTAARRELAAIRETFGLTLTDDERAAQMRKLDHGAQVAAVAGLVDLAHEFREASVELKVQWAEANPAMTKAEAGAQKGKASVSDTPAFSREQKAQYRKLAKVPKPVRQKVYALEKDAVSEADIIEAGKVYAKNPEHLDEVLAVATEKAIPVSRAKTQVLRRHKRAEKHAALTPQTLPAGRYAVVYADPPWPLQPMMQDGAKDVRDHYPTMSLQDIKGMDVGGLLAPDAILYLWVPTMFLPDGLQVMDAWGFKYSTNMVWVKPTPIVGFRVRAQHETLLVGVHGSIPQPEPAETPPSVYRSERKEIRHSRKPEYYYELMEKLYPALAKIELFARTARHGWTAYGNEGA